MNVIFPKRAINNKCSVITRIQTIRHLTNDNLSQTNFALAVCAPLVVMNIGNAVRLEGHVEWLEVTKLFLRKLSDKKDAITCQTNTYGSKYVPEVPDFREGCSVCAASEVRNGTCLSLEGILDLG